MRRQSAAVVGLVLAAGLVAASVEAQRGSAPVLAELLARYDRGEFADVTRAMADLPPAAPRGRVPEGSGDPTDPIFLELQRLAPPWIGAAGPEAVSRRRLVAAAFALELVNARRAVPWAARYPLLVWACELLRNGPTALPGERWWHLTAIALFEEADDWTRVLGSTRASVPRTAPGWRPAFFSRADREEFTAGHLAHARGAVPDEPRFDLADVQYEESLTFLWDNPVGINAHQTSPATVAEMQKRVTEKFTPSADPVALHPFALKVLLGRIDGIPRVAARYEALGRDERVRGDVELRLGFLGLRQESWAAALEHFANVPRFTGERVLVGLSHHFRGWIFDQTGRRDAAIQAYRDALTATPLARSTSLLLAPLLMQTGQQEEAFAVLHAAIKARPEPDQLTSGPAPFDAPIDPWPLYKRGDALRLRSFLLELRKSLR